MIKFLLYLILFVLLILFLCNINQPELIGQWFGKLVSGFKSVIGN
jgi:hypothetical protein